MENAVRNADRGAHPAVRTAGRVLLVSNRLPNTVTSQGTTRPSSGGLATGLRQVARRWPTVWVGWDGLARAAGAPGEVVQPWEQGSMIALAMTEAETARFYRRFCNGVLWPVLHGRIGDVAADHEDWQTYQAVNQRFADAVLRQLRPGDRIWVHDYHLMLVPALLRARTDAPIAFFLHTSFPDPEVFAAIPYGDMLLQGVLAADTLGFHTRGYAGNFLRTASAFGQRVQGHTIVTERTSQVQVHPMGIDVDTFATLARDPDVLDDVADIRRHHDRLLLGVDRLDYTKGIPQRLLAFEMLLERYPRTCGSVTFYQLAVPSREELATYRELREVVETIVRRINGRFARADWTPVEYVYGSVDLGSLAALYRAADVMVVTPVRDGLNLVAKEFVATRIDEDGVLVLSRFAGAADELDAALKVNPNRISALAEAFRAALDMPVRQRRRRMRALRATVSANTVFDWASDFLDTLDAVAVPESAKSARAKSPTNLTTPASAWAAVPSLATS